MHKKGFTLIELLLVIAIIGILSSVAVINLKSLKAKARDSVRYADVKAIQKAVELYYEDHKEYPNPECYNLAAVAACSSPNNSNDWISDLGIFLPNDPSHSTGNITDYSSNIHAYIFTRDANLPVGNPTPVEEYYYILYKRETGTQIDECDGSPYSGWSCIGGGNLP